MNARALAGLSAVQQTNTLKRARDAGNKLGFQYFEGYNNYIFKLSKKRQPLCDGDNSEGNARGIIACELNHKKQAGTSINFK